MTKINGKVCAVCYHVSDSAVEQCPSCLNNVFATDEELARKPILEPIYLLRKAPDRHEMEDPDDPVYMMSYMLTTEGGDSRPYLANLSITNISMLVNTCIQLAAADESIRRDIFLDYITESLNSLCERAKFDRQMATQGSN